MIDIHSLHIGSHVLFNGERVEIGAIHATSSDYHHYYIQTRNGNHIYQIDPRRLLPIPITEELLTELGFEKMEEDDENRTSFFHTNLKFGLMLFSDGQYYVSNLPNSLIGRYLHELEAFVYLTTKQRLI